MSNFNFPFQKILDLKEKMREQVESSYLELNQRLISEKEKLTELITKKNKLQEELLTIQLNGATIVEINQSQSYINHIEQLIARQLKSIGQIEKEIQKKRKELIKVKIDEKKWIKLKENKWQDYIDQSNKLEQKELDEIAIQRLAR
ncbi:flagellar export protein FliJ [Vulcanibacillus modesticaldus]|uniref:Flagellar FliJ protein n=1 Tax=Vulcanibacillus modesticaldus TaxID=337097 RepID=A0A1D2YXK9_9BACI|nr:flagellar export protein FliJ [Vulcanibacillus modesticaldus]OEG00403.1 flagellar export protein FliJ [Vulcanibacillus modesticaldus]